jgi:hypothetical protein
MHRNADCSPERSFFSGGGTSRASRSFMRSEHFLGGAESILTSEDSLLRPTARDGAQMSEWPLRSFERRELIRRLSTAASPVCEFGFGALLRVFRAPAVLLHRAIPNVAASQHRSESSRFGSQNRRLGTSARNDMFLSRGLSHLRPPSKNIKSVGSAVAGD